MGICAGGEQDIINKGENCTEAYTLGIGELSLQRRGEEIIRRPAYGRQPEKTLIAERINGFCYRVTDWFRGGSV